MKYKNEIWKDIPNYEGLYQISNYGNIRSLYNYKRNGTNILKPRKNRYGYFHIGLRKNKQRKWYGIHRLVAQAFIPNPNNLPCINHKDENKINNFVDNLEWCTQKYNNTYGTRLIRISANIGKRVLQYDLMGNFIKEYRNISQASRKNNIIRSSITFCCQGKYKRAGNYIWKYKGVVSQ